MVLQVKWYLILEGSASRSNLFSNMNYMFYNTHEYFDL